MLMWLFPWLSYAAIAGMGAVLDRHGIHARLAAGLQFQLHHAGGGLRAY